MFTRAISLLSVMFLLSACGGSNGANSELNSGTNVHNSDISGTSGAGKVSSSELYTLESGSQDELIDKIGDRVYFTFNSSSLTDTAQKTLRRQAGWLLKNKSVGITIEGHCDERGTREFNLALGDRRANAVKNFLMSLGVTANRVTTISYGKERPEYLGSNEAAWSKNRRAVMVVK